MTEKCHLEQMVWIPIKDGDPRALALYKRHYSAHHYKDGRRHTRFVGPGERLVLITPDCLALFVWRKFRSMNNQQGVCCSIFRNESRFLSSELIKQAVFLARQKWGGERLYTYVNPKKVNSPNPGFCFVKAGWKKCGKTKGGLVIMEYTDTHAQPNRQPTDRHEVGCPVFATLCHFT